MRFRRTRALLSRMAPAARPWLWAALVASAGLNLWFVWETPLVPFKPVCAATEADGKTRFLRLPGLPGTEDDDAYGITGGPFHYALRDALGAHDLPYDLYRSLGLRVRLKDSFANARMRHITTHTIHLLLKKRGIADRADLVHGRAKLPGFDQYGRPDCDTVRDFAFIGSKWQYDGPNPIPGTPDPAEQRKGD